MPDLWPMDLGLQWFPTWKCFSDYFDCHYFFLHFNKNAEFVITNTEPALWTRAPTMGFRIPVMARTIAIKFKVIEKVMFSLMVVIMRLERAMRWGSSFTSSSTRAMSAASTAMSLPTPPMAIPTSARFRAGASLIRFRRRSYRPFCFPADNHQCISTCLPGDSWHGLP